jgi:hypothetical protein
VVWRARHHSLHHPPLFYILKSFLGKG